MEPAGNLLFLLEPVSLALMITAIFVTCFSAFRSLNYAKNKGRSLKLPVATFTIDRSHAVLLPISSSCVLLIMFYLFTSFSALVTAIVTFTAMYSLYFCLSPYVTYMNSQFGLADPIVSRCCPKSFTRTRGMLVLFSVATVLAWLVSGHWILNNLLVIAICVSYVCHVRLPNIKICTLLLVCLFLYDIFWVYYSENFFGANVMVSVATQQASNPVHTLATSLRLPGQKMITKQLDMPVKLMFPRNLFGGFASKTGSKYMMLGLGDMAMPSMLLAVVLYYDNRKSRELAILTDSSAKRGCKLCKYIWFAVTGYAVGLVATFVTGLLTHHPQPALLFLVPSTLGPVIIVSLIRKEFTELWNGPPPSISQKLERLLELRRHIRVVGGAREVGARGGAREVGANEIRPPEMGPLEMEPLIMGPPEMGSLEMVSPEMGHGDAGPSEMGTPEMKV
ncbi:signal peptide peptidase-like 1 [Aristolochia californica]|uniref:signal peptide peptidase-like 1 n=1 Tax=Aristolochia californica TaxID=171875 RepID=UPI0035DE0974